MSKQLFYIIFVSVAICAFALGAFGTYSWLSDNILAAVDNQSEEKEIFIVNRNDTLKKIAHNLEKQGFINNKISFDVYNYFYGNQRDTRIAAGEYEISKSQKPREIFEHILSGEVFYRTVTIPEGLRLEEIVEIISKHTSATPGQLFALLSDLSLRNELGIGSDSFEGYLFPETYFFTISDTAREIITRIVEQGKQKIAKEIPEFTKRALELNLTPDKVIILASIIEKETGKPEERETISSVFHNRLRIGMPLQTDPTVMYGAANFTGPLTKDQLRDTKNAYNTYVHPGLPPGPICNPGIEAIKAALYPSDTSYLYFVSRNDGSHIFSENYSDHRKAVQEYQRGNR